MKEDAVLNDASHLVAGVGHTRLSQVIEVTITAATQSAVVWHMELVVCSPPSMVWWARPIFYRVLRPLKVRTWIAVSTPYCRPLIAKYMEPILTFRIRDSRADPRYRADRSERRRGGTDAKPIIAITTAKAEAIRKPRPPAIPSRNVH